MSSRCRSRDRSRTAILLGACFALVAVHAAEAQQPSPPTEESGPPFVAVSKLFPGGGSPPRPDPRDKLFEGNALATSEGKRLFEWYNCAGCHFHGGGGIGPALMDNQWRYGGQLDQIFASISQGRPNGMPSWHGKIPDAQIWQIAAFVKSLSAPSSANGGGEPTPTPPPPPASPSAPAKSEAPGVQSVPK